MPAYAQPLSSRAIKIVVPFGAGGVADLTARIVAQKMSDNMGQPVVIENKPGAGGVVAGDTVAKADADGPTIDQVLRQDIADMQALKVDRTPGFFVNGTPLRPLPDPVVVTAAKRKEWVWGRGNGAWNANGVTYDRYAAPYEVKEGSSEVWVHKNGGGSWSHPIHPHYEEGRILSRKGTAQPNPTGVLEGGRKDVYRLDPSETVTTAMRFRDYKGIYPMHCHNVVHEDHGMMTMWKIV